MEQIQLFHINGYCDQKMFLSFKKFPNIYFISIPESVEVPDDDDDFKNLAETIWEDTKNQKQKVKVELNDFSKLGESIIFIDDFRSTAISRAI